MAKHLIIVGAGAIGLSAAYYAARKGWRVTVVERRPQHRDGCSFGNAGMIVPSHFIPLAAPGMVALGLKWMWNPESPFYVKPRLDRELLGWGWRFWRAATSDHVRRSAPVLRDLSLASRKCFEELAGIPGNDFGLVKKGLLMLCRTQHALEEEGKTAEQARNLGIPAEVCDAGRTSSLDPNITMTIAGSVYFPLDCHFSPSGFMDCLLRQAVASGVEFAWEREVIGWRVRGDLIDEVETSSGGLRADEYLICGGSWSGRITQGLDLRIPLQAGKGYSLTLPHPPQQPQICAILTEARVAVTPMGDSLRIGGTMEISGLNEDIDGARVRGIIKAVPLYYPKFTAEHFSGIQPWRGLRPCSPDGLPYLGRTQSYSNLLLATGHAMMGMSLAPVSGSLIAQVLSGEKPDVPLNLFSPDRFA